MRGLLCAEEIIFVAPQIYILQIVLLVPYRIACRMESSLQLLQREIMKINLKMEINEAVDDIFRWAIILHQSILNQGPWIWAIERASFLSIVAHYERCVFCTALLRTRNDVLRLLRPSLPDELFGKVKGLLDCYYYL